MKRLLYQLAACGDISWLSLYFAEFIATQDKSSIDAMLCLSAARLCEANQQGSVCIDLADLAGQPMFASSNIDQSQIPVAPTIPDWCSRLQASACVGQAGVRSPLTLEGERLYLNRYWHYESFVAARILSLVSKRGERDSARASEIFDRLHEDDTAIDSEQKQAVLTAVQKSFSVISGGPGSGKTSTVVRILCLLLALDPDYRIALTAPTGKAAARMMASIDERMGQVDPDANIGTALPTSASTVHRLLGYARRGFEFDASHRLPYDCVIVDEASMVDLKLMYHLLAALPDGARLILLGDRDQLASVAAGNVLGDITGHGQDLAAGDPAIASCIALLRGNYRFDENTAIGELAALINRGQADAALGLLANNQRGLHWYADAGEQVDAQALESMYAAFQPIFTSATPAAALDVYENTRVLCATNQGPLGVQSLNRQISNALTSNNGVAETDLYHGLPIMINRNHHALGLYNGDTGILWRFDSGLRACFRGSDDDIRDIAINRLPDFSAAWASTVHKSQGSEFDTVLLIMPAETESEVLCRELFYTAVTRARRQFVLHGGRGVVAAAIERLTQRYSGLAQRLGWPR